MYNCIFFKDPTNTEILLKMAFLAYNEFQDYPAATRAISKILQLEKHNNKARLLLLLIFNKIGRLDQIENVVKTGLEYEQDFCKKCLSYFISIGIPDCCKDVLKRVLKDKSTQDIVSQNILSDALTVAIAWDLEEKEKLFKKFKSKLDLSVTNFKPRIKNNKIHKKVLELSENMILLLPIGRSGSLFFHSLIDGHPEIATIPGVYLKGFFDWVTWQQILSNNRFDIVRKFFVFYDAIFDANSHAPVPGNPMEPKFGIGKKLGLTEMGEDRTQSLKIDKEKFKKYLLELLEAYYALGEKEFFILIHLAMEKVRGHDIFQKKALFYHIHNPSPIEFLRTNKFYPKLKNLYIVRHFVQSLESWMYLRFPTSEKYIKCKTVQERFSKFYFKHKEMYVVFKNMFFITRPYFYLSNNNWAVRLEDIKLAPEQTMKKIANFMGVNFSNEFLKSEFFGLKYHSVFSKLHKNISGFDPSSIKRKIGVLFGEKDILLYNYALYPYIEKFGYSELYDIPLISKDDALKINNGLLEWEEKLIDIFKVEKKDVEAIFKFRKKDIEFLINNQDSIKKQLERVNLLIPE